MHILKQNEHKSPHSNSITKIAKITNQSLIEVIKRFQRHWSSVSTSKK